MRSNINDVLKLVDGGVQVCGPLEWDKGESDAIAVVTIRQDDTVAGVSSSPPNFEESETEWSLTVPPPLPHKKFKKGPAHATAQIFALGDGIATFVYPCDKEVELEE